MGRAWIIIAVAAAGPAIGSAIGVLLPRGRGAMYRMLAFAAGTMLAISFGELLPEAAAQSGAAGGCAGMVCGAALMALLSDMLPDGAQAQRSGGLRRTALMMLAAITLHNFPEGLAMASAASGGEEALPLMIAVAIAVHDIPEGICTAAPYYAATGRRLRAFLLSACTALPTIAGYLAGRLLFGALGSFMSGVATGAAAGMMVYISCEELLPAARGGGGRHLTAAALFGGIAFVMALSALTGAGT